MLVDISNEEIRWGTSHNLNVFDLQGQKDCLKREYRCLHSHNIWPCKEALILRESHGYKEDDKGLIFCEESNIELPCMCYNRVTQVFCIFNNDRGGCKNNCNAIELPRIH